MQLVGVDGLGDLTSVECATKYKNPYEDKLELTRDGLIIFYNELLDQFNRLH